MTKTADRGNGMNTMLKSAITAAMLGLAVSVVPAHASQTHVVIKMDGKPDLPVTDDTIAKLGTVEYKVKLDDVDGEAHRLKGPLLRSLLAAADAAGKSVVAAANDGCSSEIPVADIAQHDGMVAVAVDGQPFSADENATAHIAYPVIDVPALQGRQDIHDHLVFQLKELSAK